MLEQNTMKAILEAMLFASDKPVTLKQMTTKIRTILKKEQSQLIAEEESLEVVQEDNREENEDALQQLMQKQQELESDIATDDIKKLLFVIEEDLNQQDRGIELVQVARGYQLRTKYDISQYLKEDKKVSPTRLSPSSMETLAIVAYEQPVTRTRIEEIRGVDCGGVLKTLLDKDFLRIVGRSDDAGRPLIYGTTNKFLEIFSLNSLKDLPKPEDFQEFAQMEDVVVGEDVEGVREYIHAEDFEDVSELSSAEQAILNELDASLSELKSVEKGIDLFQEKKEDAQEAVTEKKVFNE